MEVKQVIVLRKDLKLRRGKEIAVCAHAAMEFIRKRLNYGVNFTFSGELDHGIEIDWLEDIHKKICVTVDSEEELLRIHEEATGAGLESNLIKDLGLTELKEPTYTCLAIGPWYSDEIDKITGHLKLY